MLRIAAYLILFCLFFYLQIYATTSVGIVDMNEIFTAYEKTKQLSNHYEKESQVIQQEIIKRNKKLQEEWKSLEDQQNHSIVNNSTNSIITRTKNIMKVRDLDQEMVDFQSEKYKEIKKAENRMRQEIIQDIINAINSINQDKHFDIILDKSALSSSSVPFVVYADNKLDISKKVIMKLNTTWKASSE